MLKSLLKSDFKILSEIMRDVAQVFFATAVVAQVVAGLDIKNLSMVISGSVMSFLCWYLSLMLGRRASYE